MELLYWYSIGLCQIKQQKWNMHVLNPTGLNCFCFFQKRLLNFNHSLTFEKKVLYLEHLYEE